MSRQRLLALGGESETRRFKDSLPFCVKILSINMPFMLELHGRSSSGVGEWALLCGWGVVGHHHDAPGQPRQSPPPLPCLLSSV